MARILVVDDDADTCRFLEELLDAPGRQFVSVQDPEAALAEMRRDPFDLLISDINLNAPSSGLDLLRRFRREHGRPVVLISGFGTLETAIEAVRAGAFDYISKPFDIAEIKRIVDRALQQEVRQADAAAEMPAGATGTLIGRTAAMLDVYKQIAHAADSSAPVLISGESGVGKELVARAIHGHSRRAREPFVGINCGAIADTLLESELFGHQRGAFTGAHRAKPGKFELAHTGTIFLDEIGEMPLPLQAKLLHVLQDHQFARLGSRRDISVDVRIVAATNRQIESLVDVGAFRADLYYRLNVVSVHVPPLRERREEIPILIETFLAHYASRYGRAPRRISPETLQHFMAHPWPGNVRQLENMVKRIVALDSEAWVVEDLVTRRREPEPAPAAPHVMPAASTASRFASLEDVMSGGGLKEIARRAAADAERMALECVLEQVRWNRLEAARLLKVNYKTVLQKIRDLKLGDGQSRRRA